MGRGLSYRGGQESLLPNSQLGPFSGKTCLRVNVSGSNVCSPPLPVCDCLWVGTHSCVEAARISLCGDLWLLPGLEAAWGSPEFSEVGVVMGVRTASSPR